MTKEEQKEYMKRWRKQNRDRIKQNEKAREQRRALEAISSIKRLSANVCIVRSKDGTEFIVGGRST